MGLLDNVIGAVEKHPEMSQEQHTSLVQHAVEMFGNRAGISNLANAAESQGVGHIVQSWIGNGGNQNIAPQQVQGLIGPDRLNELASKVGISPNIASAALSRVLPMVIDKFSSQGKAPQAA